MYMKMIGMLLFMLLPLVAVVYVSWHLWTLLPLNSLWKTVVVAVAVGCFLLLFADMSGSLDRLSLPLARVLYTIGTSSVVIMLYLVILFLVLDLGRLTHVVPSRLLTNSWTTTVAVVVLMTAVFVYGNLHYRHKVRQPLSFTSTKALKKDYRFVMASDLHLGYHNPRTELARWVDLMNAEHADAILIAGDIVDISVRPLLEEDMAKEFRRLNAPVYACLGNHEYYSGEPDAQRFYYDAGIRLLQDETALIDNTSVVAGRDDRTNRRRKSMAELLGNTSRDNYIIVLDHQPYHLEESEQNGVDLQLSGHTHHGQVWPISWITEALYECAFGQHQRGNTHYYVSSGLGIWGGKFRIGTRSEYAVITLSHQP